MSRVVAGLTHSPNRSAPSFEQIARVPGMTPLAVTAALQTSHRTMPKIMLNPAELRNVIAYITSLKGGRRGPNMRGVSASATGALNCDE